MLALLLALLCSPADWVLLLLLLLFCPSFSSFSFYIEQIFSLFPLFSRCQTAKADLYVCVHISSAGGRGDTHKAIVGGRTGKKLSGFHSSTTYICLTRKNKIKSMAFQDRELLLLPESFLITRNPVGITFLHVGSLC